MIGKAPVTPSIETLSTAGVPQCRATAKSRKRRLGPSAINRGLRGQENEGANHARVLRRSGEEHNHVTIWLIATGPPDRQTYRCGLYQEDRISRAKQASPSMAVEIKAASRWDEHDLAGLKAFLKATKQCAAGILACNTPAPVKPGGKLGAIPLTVLFSRTAGPLWRA